MRIVLDTNFLIYSVLYKIDFFNELIGNELFITSAVKSELEGISRNMTKEGIAAKVILEMLDERVEVIETEKSADASIVELAYEGYAVATLDEEIQNKVKSKVKVFVIKAKKTIREL